MAPKVRRCMILPSLLIYWTRHYLKAATSTSLLKPNPD